MGFMIFLYCVRFQFDFSGSGPEICLMEPQSRMEPFSGGTFLNLWA
jgi:hypothetical protein